MKVAVEHAQMKRSLFLFVCFMMIIDMANAGFRFNGADTGRFKDQPDPYKVLGVRKHASPGDIKTAYRNMAKKYHPDKNRDNPEASADKFRDIAQAFETLSDPKTRRDYDNEQRFQAQQQARHSARFRQQQEESARRKRQQEAETARKKREMVQAAKQIQSKVIRLTTIAEFKAIALDDQGKLKKRLLMVFVADKKIEKFVDEQVLFPYVSNIDNSDFSHAVTAIKVRYNSDTDLSQFLGVFAHAQAKQTGRAYLIAGSQGENLSQLKQQILKIGSHEPHSNFETWAARIMPVKVKVINMHSHLVRVFHLKANGMLEERNIATLEPGFGRIMDFNIGDSIWALDANVDEWPSHYHSGKLDMSLLKAAKDKVLLGNWKLLKDQTIEIMSKYCVDMSTFCDTWIQIGKVKCQDKPEFMHSVCAKSCGVCHESPLTGLTYILLHKRITYWPRALHGVIKFIRVFTQDMTHVLELRKNAAGAFFAFGAIIAFMIYGFKRTWFNFLIRCCAGHLVLAVGMIVLVQNKGFMKDLMHVISFRKNVIFFFAVFGFVVCYALSWSVDWIRYSIKDAVGETHTAKRGPDDSDQRQNPNHRKSSKGISVWYLGVLMLPVALLLLSSNATFMNDLEHVIAFRKNAAGAAFALGAMIAFMTYGLKRTWIKYFIGWCLSVLCFAVASMALASNKAFRIDLIHVLAFRRNVVFLFAVSGFVMCYTLSLTAHWIRHCIKGVTRINHAARGPDDYDHKLKVD